MTETTRTPVTLCWHCDRMLDAASDMEPEGAKPFPGAVSLCLYCGAVAFFDGDLVLRPPTKEELDELGNDREFRQNYARFGWARQYVMINHHLLGYQAEHEDPEDPHR